MFITMKSSLRKWKKITGRIDDPTIHQESIKMIDACEPIDMCKWMLRGCDRSDTHDWMPYKIIVTGSVRTYYVNTNARSNAYAHMLILRVYGKTISIEEWNHDIMISNTPAVVEITPKNKKPTDADRLNIMDYLEQSNQTSM